MSLKYASFISVITAIATLFITLYLMSPLYIDGFYNSHDGELHLGRIPAYAREVFSGQIPVRWSGSLNYAWGSPVFSFMYPLPYLFTSIFYGLSIDTITTFKLSLAISHLGSGILMGLYIFKTRKNLMYSVVSSIVYMYMPYRLFNLYTRAAFGEVFFFIFPPLVLLGIHLLLNNQQVKGFLLTSLAIAGMVISHNALTLAFAPWLFIWFYVNKYKESKSIDKQSIIRSFNNIIGPIKHKLVHKKSQLNPEFLYPLTWVYGLCISAFFWLPAIIEKKYTMIDIFLSQKNYQDHYLSISKLISNSWNYSDTIPFLGISGLIIACLAIFAILKSNQKVFPSYELYWLSILLLSLFMTTKYSELIWQLVPGLEYFQLPWRFLSLSVLATSLLVPSILQLSNKYQLLSIIILVLVLLESKPVINQVTTKYTSSEQFLNYSGTTTWHEEATPIWTGGAADRFPTGKYSTSIPAIVTVSKDTSTHQSFEVQSNESLYFTYNHNYFPGWKAYIDGDKVPVQFQDPDSRGLMQISIPPGIHQIEFKFTRTKVRAIADSISIIGILLLGLTIITISRRSKLLRSKAFFK